MSRVVHPSLVLALAALTLLPSQETSATSRESRWRELAARCGSDIAWAKSWEDAAARAAKEEKLVFVAYEHRGALALPATLLSGPFTDPDLVALLDARFVSLRMRPADAAPFRAPTAYGMSEHSFGEAFLFVQADGAVVGETGIREASYLAQCARAANAQYVATLPARSDPVGTPVERATELIACGALERASAALASETEPRALLLRAGILRQLRRGRDALALLRAIPRTADRALSAEAAADEALVHMRMGDLAAARAGFERVVREHAESLRVSEALYWLGAFDFVGAGASPSTARWNDLVDRFDDRFACKAAANLSGTGSFVNGRERFEWPDESLVAAVLARQRAPLPIASAEEAERGARAWLLAAQRDDGSWLCPIDAFAYGSNLYTPAITAICGASLLETARDERSTRAVKRALARLLTQHASGAFDAGEGLAGVYSIWSRTFVLSFAARCLREGFGDAAALRATIGELVTSIEASQHAGGGWPYVTFPGDPTGERFDPSASFLTAGVCLALFDARDVGAQVSDECASRALRFLDELRRPDGSYRYMRGIAGMRDTGAHPEAAGRGPLCSFALWRGGACDAQRVRASLEQFVKHQPALAREWHKELCHTGPDAQGSHYLFYDYRHAAEAARSLPADARAPFREAILRDVLAARFDDGSFEDMPGLGRAYATAMALFTLRALRE